jgi:hypothetical protein
MAIKPDYENTALWANVPEPTEQVDFIVDEVKDNVFTVLVDREVADYDVAEAMYLIGGIWRITQVDTDDDEDVPSVVLEITVDRRFKAEEVRAAIIKLLENMYLLDT